MAIEQTGMQTIYAVCAQTPVRAHARMLPRTQTLVHAFARPVDRLRAYMRVASSWMGGGGSNVVANGQQSSMFDIHHMFSQRKR